MATVNYQCPACTGPLHFVGASGQLECDYCGSRYEPAEIEALYAAKEGKAAAAQQKEDARAEKEKAELSELGYFSEEELAGMKSYNCTSCGAELVCDENTAATSCPYCGNPVVMSAQVAGVLKPDLILPFKLSKEDAVAALKEFYKGKKLLPNAFSDKNHIEEIKGVYVPFWLHNGKIVGHARYDGTITRSWREGDDEVTEYTHYDVVREGEMDFARIPTDASSKMPDSHMDAIEPFDYSELKPFSTAYLPGFLADRYDVEESAARERAGERAAATAADALRAAVDGYSSLTREDYQYEFEPTETHYALLPVWVLSTRWKDQNFLFAMNGQTGKLVGDLPMDKGKYWKLFASIVLPVAAIALLAALL